MKKISISLIIACVIVLTAIIFSMNCGDEKDDVQEQPKIFKNGLGDVVFYHKNHQKHTASSLEQSCKNCHSRGGYPKQAYREKDKKKRMDKAHKICVGCHKKSGKTSCKVCHEQ